MPLTINKGKMLKTAGWITIGLGLYMLSVGTIIDGDVDYKPKMHDDNIIDVDFTVVND